MKLWWAKYRGTDDAEMTESMRANALGYVGSSTKLFRALQDSGIEFSKDADTWVWYCHPKVFLWNEAERQANPGKRHILLTMYEGMPLPPEFEEAFKIADGILTPSKFCRDLFKPIAHGKSVALTGLGFDREVFTYAPRTIREGEPFRFLYCGAPNARKGFPQVINAWKWCGFMRAGDLFSLTMKTTSETEEEQANIKNIRFDSSFLTVQQLADLYHSHHCLVAPTHGEGWGLVPMEALATGMPVISTKYSGVLDFLNEGNCYFTPHTFKFANQKLKDGGDVLFRAAVADIPSLGRTMADVVKNYNHALRKAKKGSMEIHSRFGWPDVAKRLIDTIRGMQTRWAS